MWVINPELHILLASMHHIITDGWSVDILMTELATAYAAAVAGKPPGWDPLPVQLVDYAAWQRQHVQLDEEVAWWREALTNAPPLLELPTDRPRPDVFSYCGAELRASMPPVTARAVLQAAAAHETTPFVVALTTLQVSTASGPFEQGKRCRLPSCVRRWFSCQPWPPNAWSANIQLWHHEHASRSDASACARMQALLKFYSGSDDIVVGSPYANRDPPEVEGLLGCFVNVLALRLDLAGDPSFGAALRRAKEATAQAFAHGAAPFARVVEALSTVRSAAFTPIYQVRVNNLYSSCHTVIGPKIWAALTDKVRTVPSALA